MPSVVFISFSEKVHDAHTLVKIQTKRTAPKPPARGLKLFPQHASTIKSTLRFPKVTARMFTLAIFSASFFSFCFSFRILHNERLIRGKLQM